MILKQSQLIKRNIELIGLNDTNPKATQIVEILLNKNTNWKDRDKNSFYYHSVIVFLSYLVGCTRLDISIAVH